MKNTIIDEILDPLTVVLDNMNDPDDIARLKLAINKMRVDMGEFFGELFEPDDSFYDELSGEGFRAGADSIYEDETF
jgi:hypothetical protein